VQHFRPRVYYISTAPSVPCIICIMSINLEFKHQQCCIICIQFKLLANKIIQDVKTAFSPHQSVLNFCSAATNGHSAADASPSYAAILPCLVYQPSNRRFGHQRRYMKRLTIVIQCFYSVGQPAAACGAKTSLFV